MILLMRGLLLAMLLCLPARGLAAGDARDLVASARAQIGVTKTYDPAYVALKYPAGDVPPETGVCSDVVVRAFRKLGLDLQKLVHEDMRANFAKYPQKWGLKKPDPNIDHRRVPNLMKYFERQGAALAASKKPADYRAGDVVAWNLGGGITHIGIVSDAKATDGTPLIIHNIGRGAQEENLLFKYEIIGHYRWRFAP
ncbi:MAG: DUF1287 domain-containing protein [Desulfobacterales bacterium]|nr:DUF1287 domain-containing protein [Desulfobacterales bacterium]